MNRNIIAAAAAIFVTSAGATGVKPPPAPAPAPAPVTSTSGAGSESTSTAGAAALAAQQQAQQAAAEAAQKQTQQATTGPIQIEGDTSGDTNVRNRALALVAPSINFGASAVSACLGAGPKGRSFLWGAYTSTDPVLVEAPVCNLLALADRAASMCQHREAYGWRAAAGRILGVEMGEPPVELVNDDPLRCIEERAKASAQFAAAPIAPPAAPPINVVVNVDLAQAQTQEQQPAARTFQPKRRPTPPCPDGQILQCVPQGNGVVTR